jgi:hypothetical protein
MTSPPATHLTNGLGHTHCDFRAFFRAAIAEILILWILQFEILGPKETADAGCLFGAGDDALTLVGLDDDWGTIDLQPNLAQKRDDPPLDDNDPGCMARDLSASSTGLPWHANSRSDAPCFPNLDAAALDQFMLDLDSDDEEMAEGETVLDF